MQWAVFGTDTLLSVSEGDFFAGPVAKANLLMWGLDSQQLHDQLSAFRYGKSHRLFLIQVYIIGANYSKKNPFVSQAGQCGNSTKIVSCVQEKQKTGSFPVCWWSTNITLIPKGWLSPLVAKLPSPTLLLCCPRYMNDQLLLAWVGSLKQIVFSLISSRPIVRVLVRANNLRLLYKLCSVGVIRPLFSVVYQFFIEPQTFGCCG